MWRCERHLRSAASATQSTENDDPIAVTIRDVHDAIQTILCKMDLSSTIHEIDSEDEDEETSALNQVLIQRLGILAKTVRFAKERYASDLKYVCAGLSKVLKYYSTSTSYEPSQRVLKEAIFNLTCDYEFDCSNELQRDVFSP